MYWWLKRERNKKKFNFFESRERNQKFYNSTKWIKLRTIKMINDPLCEHCALSGRTEIATEVHHIVPISTVEGWKKRLSYDGLVSLCKSCHSIATRMEEQQRRLQRINDYMNDLNSFDDEEREESDT